MTRSQVWKSRLIRLFITAAVGGIIANIAGRIALWANGSCSVLCDPAVSFPLGGITGVFAFWNVGRD